MVDAQTAYGAAALVFLLVAVGMAAYWSIGKERPRQWVMAAGASFLLAVALFVLYMIERSKDDEDEDDEDEDVPVVPAKRQRAPVEHRAAVKDPFEDFFGGAPVLPPPPKLPESAHVPMSDQEQYEDVRSVHMGAPRYHNGGLSNAWASDDHGDEVERRFGVTGQPERIGGARSRIDRDEVPGFDQSDAAPVDNGGSGRMTSHPLFDAPPRAPVSSDEPTAFDPEEAARRRADLERRKQEYFNSGPPPASKEREGRMAEELGRRD